jgi:hypothetical protein
LASSAKFGKSDALKKLDWREPWLWGEIVIAMFLALLLPAIVFLFKTLPRL